MLEHHLRTSLSSSKLTGESEEELLNMVNAFSRVRKKRRLKVNANESKTILFEGRDSECEI